MAREGWWIPEYIVAGGGDDLALLSDLGAGLGGTRGGGVVLLGRGSGRYGWW